MIPTEYNFDTIVIVYHHNCIDGTAGAWVLKHYFESMEDVEPDSIIFIGQQPQCPELYNYFQNNKINTRSTKTRHKIIFVDICPSIDIIRQLITDNKSNGFMNHIAIYDHHETNKNIFIDYVNELEPYIKYVFDMERSGCQIAWDEFYDNKPRPLFIDYIGDGDLWKFKSVSSKLAYNILMRNFTNIDKLESLYQLGDVYFTDKENKLRFYKHYLEKEYIIHDYKKNKIQEYINNAKLATWTVHDTLSSSPNQYNIWFVQCTDYDLVSELGNTLCFKDIKLNASNSKPDFIAILKYIKYDSSNTIKYEISLRSNNTTKPDINVSTISSIYGGGGHAQASGCSLNHDMFMSTIKW